MDASVTSYISKESSTLWQKKYWDVRKRVNTYKMQNDNETLHSIPASLREWSQTGIDLIDPMKEIDGYRDIVTAVKYTSKFVEVETLNEKKNPEKL